MEAPGQKSRRTTGENEHEIISQKGQAASGRATIAPRWNTCCFGTNSEPRNLWAWDREAMTAGRLKNGVVKLRLWKNDCGEANGPPTIHYDNLAKPAVLTPELPKPATLVEVAKPLPLPDQLKPMVLPPAQIVEPKSPRVRGRQGQFGRASAAEPPRIRQCGSSLSNR